TRKWVRELVGTIPLDRFAELRDELVCRVFQAVVGTSRLPLTSVEAPLPAFSLGQLAYFYRGPLPAEARSTPMTFFRELAELARDGGLSESEKAKLLETLLHVTPVEELGPAADVLFGTDAAPATALLTLFNEVSLSPYTDLVEKA